MPDDIRRATPFGQAEFTFFAQNQTVLAGQSDPRATAYAAKEIGATRLIELVPSQALDRLLPARTLLVPHDLIDLKQGAFQTLFHDKGYGFIGQNPVFCPDIRSALIDAATTHEPTTFVRGVVALVDPEPADDPTAWGAHVSATTVSPLVYFAKELELCYAPLCVLGHPANLDAIVTAAVATLPAERGCPCATAMQFTRQRGLIGDDWRTWIGEPAP